MRSVQNEQFPSLVAPSEMTQALLSGLGLTVNKPMNAGKAAHALGAWLTAHGTN